MNTVVSLYHLSTIRTNPTFAMRRIILTIICTIASLCSFAQRVNERGLKCVSEIEMSGRQTSNQRYVFEYFDDLRLKSMSVYHGNVLYYTFTMNNGVLTRKDYDNFGCEWNYDMDVYGNVARITMTCIGSDGSGFKNEHTYTYAQSESHPWRNVIEDNTIEFARLSRTKPFRRNNNDDVHKFEYRDGIMQDVTFREIFPKEYTEERFNRLKTKYNFSVKNDTNIDFWQLWEPKTSNETIIALTEWLCLRPDYLMNDVASHYEYEYDNDGNLIRIIDRSWDMKYIYKEIKIKYLY